MQRNPSIDLFRGLAIVLMILANYLAGPDAVPAWLKHAPDVGMTVIDLIAPFFIFAIGLTYALSAQRRFARDGWKTAAAHFAVRYLALIGIGCLLSAGESFFGLSASAVNWGVLQAIGTAGLITLALIRQPAWLRAAVALALLAVYQIALELGMYTIVLYMPHGGLPGALNWTAMLLLATALADAYHAPRRRWLLWAGSGAALALGLGLAAAGLVISKNRVSSSYVLVSLGASGLLFGLVDWAVCHLLPREGEQLLERKPLDALALLAAWGRNPLLLYLLQDLGLAFFFLPPFPGWYAQAPLWLVALQAAALLATLNCAAWKLRGARFIL
jgi:predicted acyltransferase